MTDRVSLKKQGDIWVLNLHSSPKDDGKTFENTFNPEFIEAIHKALDTVEEDAGTECALVTTSTGKIFSNGLDLEWLMTQEMGGKTQLDFLDMFHKLLLRVLVFPLPTICAANGHCFAGGFLFSLAHDYRVMNKDKGFACMTEVNMGQTLTPPLTALIKEKLPRRLAAKIMLEACRLNAGQLLEEKVIEHAVSQDRVLETSIALAKEKAPKGTSMAYGMLKEDMYSDAVQCLKSGPVIRASL